MMPAAAATRHSTWLFWALLLSSAACALAARQEGPKPTTEAVMEATSSKYGGDYSGRHDKYSGHHKGYDYGHDGYKPNGYKDGYSGGHYKGGYDSGYKPNAGYKHHKHASYHKGGDYDGPYYKGDGPGPEYYRGRGGPYDKHDPSYYPENYFFYEGDGPNGDYYPPKECTECPKNTTKCPNPLSTNGYQCLDTVNSPFSCGTCTKVCQPNADCVDSNCECKEGFTDCGGECVDTTSNPNFCGGCDPCPTNEFCVNSTCTAVNPCGEGEVQCFPSPSSSGTCRNLTNDPEACGSCNRECSQLLDANTCTNGECCVGNGGTCRAGFQCCGWSVLSLVPVPDSLAGLVFPTARCQQSGILPLPIGTGRCCKDVVSTCDTDSECCSGLSCRQFTFLGTTSKQCLPDSCKLPGAGTCKSTGCCPGSTCLGPTNALSVCTPVAIPDIPI